MNGHCEDHGDDGDHGTPTTSANAEEGSSQSHGALGATQIVGVVIGIFAGVSVVLMVVLCAVAMLANYQAYCKDDGVASTYKKDSEQKKYAEIKFQDSVSDSLSLDKDGPTISTGGATDEEVKEKDSNNFVIV